MHELTALEHIESNLSMAIDQAHDYVDPYWTAADAFAQGTYDSMIADGYTPEEAFEAKNEFYSHYENRCN
jgi:hypothetical protein